MRVVRLQPDGTVETVGYCADHVNATPGRYVAVREPPPRGWAPDAGEPTLRVGSFKVIEMTESMERAIVITPTSPPPEWLPGWTTTPPVAKARRGWIGVDFDGTIAEYHGWRGEGHLGEPIPAMVNRVRGWLAVGQEVRVFTARISASQDGPEGVERMRHAIEDWCARHVGQRLAVTNVKDFQMIELWDDRAVQVVPNTGRRADGAA